MSDNITKTGNDGLNVNEPSDQNVELKNMISKAIANKDKSSKEQLNDISFPKKSTPVAVPANANMNAQPSKDLRKSNVPKGSQGNRRPNVSRGTANTGKNNRNSQGGQRVVSSSSSAGKKQNATRRPQGIQDRNNKNLTALKGDMETGVVAATSDVKKRRKSKWSKKKKIWVSLGFVFLFLCLLPLFAWSFINHYVSMIKKDDGGINTERPNYSDVDHTKPDTLDGEAEDEKLKKALAKNASNLMSDKDVLNILLIGEDIRDTAEISRGNTDVMMMISVNTRDKTITMTSFMRDIYLYLPDAGYSNRLNAAYSYGGANSLKNTLEKYFGVTIDKYVIVNFYSFIDIVNAVGGLELDVTDEEAQGMKAPMGEQNKYLGNAKGTDYLSSGGKGLKLNGNQSLAYARLRYVGAGDYERTQRQRRVITEMINKSKKLSLSKLDSLITKVLKEENVKSDLETGDVASLLLSAFEYMDYDIQEIRVPADNTFTEERINGMDVLSVDFTMNTKIIQETIYGETNISDNDDSSQIEAGYDQYGNFIGDQGYYDKDGNYVGAIGYYDEYGNFVLY